jgi:hypothetical protein
MYNRWYTGGTVVCEYNGSATNTKRSRITTDLLQACTEVWKVWTTYYSSFSFVLPILSSVSVHCHVLSSVPCCFHVSSSWPQIQENVMRLEPQIVVFAGCNDDQLHHNSTDKICLGSSWAYIIDTPKCKANSIARNIRWSYSSQGPHGFHNMYANLRVVSHTWCVLVPYEREAHYNLLLAEYLFV